ncbi:MAG: polyprenyl synthetase family protein [Oscillospiraceae bacterium]
MIKHLDEYKNMIEKSLATLFSDAEVFPQRRLLEAMNYSLTAGGKRIRPILTLAFCAAAGGNPIDAFPIAAAVEMLHTYSLIHDDLPCMDNDALRRGKPTNHKVYGEATAILAGDSLQAEAFGEILRCELPIDVRLACAIALADAAGVDGICGGQQLDMEGEERCLSEDELIFMQSGKTGSLFVCACKMGAIVGGASEKQIEAAALFGASLGSAFQIRDDMLDVTSSEQQMGKTVGSDIRDGKTTFMSLYGEEKCRGMVEKLSERAKSVVTDAFEDVSALCEIADMLNTRNN